MKELRCDMSSDCEAPISHIDRSGWLYCEAHGLGRRMSQPCRKLPPAELRRLERGETVERY